MDDEREERSSLKKVIWSMHPGGPCGSWTGGSTNKYKVLPSACDFTRSP